MSNELYIIPIEPLIGGLRLIRSITFSSWIVAIEPLIGGLILHCRTGCFLLLLPIEPLIGGLIPFFWFFWVVRKYYWTPYRGIEMLICFPWKRSGGAVVYGCGVWRVKSWVKNVLDTNKYIAISPIKWGWSSLTYLPLVFIIPEKSISLFYWIPFRGLMLAIKNLFIFWPLLNPL